MKRAHVILSVAAATIVAGYAVAGSAATRLCGSESECAKQQVARTSSLRPAMISSPNWAGYIATAPTGKTLNFKTVTGTWTVPSARCTPGKLGTYSTIWVGIGGYHQTWQDEVGTDANCSKSGTGSYYAWFEIVPYLSFPTVVGDKVKAGDTITGLVKFLTPKLIELQLKNRTRGWTFTRKINWAINDTSTAEWIVESPAVCKVELCQEASLSNFHTATMRNISATANGSTGNLWDPNWKIVPVRLVPAPMTVPDISPTAISAGHDGAPGEAASPAGATPSKPSKDGRSFSWTWVKVASRGV